MRVAHIITRLIVGGAQENTIATVLGLQARGIPSRLFAGPTTGPEGSLEPLVQGAGVLTIIPTLVRPVRPWSDWRALRHLTGELAALHPDIVHTHSGKAGVLGRIAARRAKVRFILHTIHGPSFGPFQGGIANLLFRAAERCAARRTDHFVVVADAMKEQYLRAGIGRPEQYTRIFSGFPLDPFLRASKTPGIRSQLGLAPDDWVVGKIARLFALKGHDYLFAIAPRLVRHCPKLKFLLVGGGPWRERFEKKSIALGLRDHFVFTGLVPPERIPELIASMDLLVHLSQREGLPRALPQALATARPVIAFDVDGAKEVCQDGQTGFLVPFANLEMLEERIRQLAADAVLRKRLGAAGQAFVQARFSEETMVNEITQLYRRLLPHDVSL